MAFAFQSLLWNAVSQFLRPAWRELLLSVCVCVCASVILHRLWIKSNPICSGCVRCSAVQTLGANGASTKRAAAEAALHSRRRSFRPEAVAWFRLSRFILNSSMFCQNMCFFSVFFLPSARPSENTPYRGGVAFSDGSEMRCLPLSLRSRPKPCYQQHRCTWFLRHYTVIPDKTSYQHIVDSQLEREASTLLLILETSWTVDSRATGSPDTNTHINRAGPGRRSAVCWPNGCLSALFGSKRGGGGACLAERRSPPSVCRGCRSQSRASPGG